MEIFKTGLILYNGTEWRWKLTQSGIYSVKSGYELARQWKTSNRLSGAEISDWTENTKIWAKFWKIRIPDRIKLVTWRIFYDSLPLFSNLLTKGCSMKTNCLFCGFKKENCSHLFFDCWMAKCIWKSVGLVNKRWLLTDSWNIDDRIWYILIHEDPKLLKLITMVFWVIWFNRNQVAHGKSILSVTTCCSKINNYLYQVEKQNLAGSSYRNNQTSECVVPTKFFSDGSWSHLSKTGGWSVTAMVGETILRCKSGYSDGSLSDFEMEIKGLIEAIRLAKIMECIHVEFYSDRTEAIWAMQCGYGGGISESLLSEFNEGIAILHQQQNWTLIHSFREDNSISDFLANKARIYRWEWNHQNALPILPEDVSKLVSTRAVPISTA